MGVYLASARPPARMSALEPVAAPDPPRAAVEAISESPAPTVPPPAAGPAPAEDTEAPSPAPPRPQKRPPSAAEHLRAADSAAAGGNHIRELYHLQTAVSLEPQNPVALLRLGRALLADRQSERACDLLARAGRKGSKEAENLHKSANCAASAPH
jgi:hypothetical protein